MPGKLRSVGKVLSGIVLAVVVYACLQQDRMASRIAREAAEEAREFGTIAEALEAYEAIRWPDGKIPGGKG